MTSEGLAGGDRFTGHGPALEEIQGQLRASRTPRERAALAGRLLVVIGDLGRRQKAVPRSGVDGALRAMQREDLEGWLLSADAESMQAELARAAESALEVALADTDSERTEYGGWAMEALARRDNLESALTALERWEAMGNTLGTEGQRARERVRAELARIEVQRPSLVRQLLSVNAARRQERDRLDPEQRGRAWWYSARAECEPLSLAMDAAAKPSSHSQSCEECRRDRERASKAERPASGHVTADELWDLDTGAMSSSRRRFIEKHARGCAECAQALRALVEEGEPSPVAPPSPAAPRESAPELMQAREEFKVLLFRDPRRARLTVEPVKSLRIAAVGIEAPWAGSPSPARAGTGWEIELGPAKALRGRRVGLRVEIAGGATVALEFDL